MTTVDGQAGSAAAPGVAPRATWREWLGLAIMCLPTMLTTVDLNVMFLALPHVTADLGSSSTEQLWISDIYGFMIAGFLITMGTLGDRIGRKKVLLFGGAAFLAASLLAAFATSTIVLIIARALLGAAGATLIPSILALLRTMFKDPKQMGAAMGLWGTSLMAGVVLGPVVGGLMLGAFWWGSVFLLAVPIMGLLLLAGPALLPESKDPAAGRLDLFSVALSLLAILPFIYGLKELAREGWAPLPAVSLVAGVVFFVVFLRRQATLAHPLLDLSLFRIRALSTALTMALMIAFVMGGAGLMASLYMQMVEGLSPVRVGTLLLIPSVVMIVVGNLAPAIARKVPPGYVLAAGSLIAAVGMVVLTQVGSTAGLTTLLVGLGVVYVGGASVGPMTPFLVMSSTPPEKAGAAGSVSSAVGELGVALGVAILGLVGTATYRSQVSVPSELPADAANTAKESIAGATVVAEQVGGPTAGSLLDSAREAFTNGLNNVAVVCAVLFVVLALVSFIGLRHVPSLGDMPMPGMPPKEPKDPEAAGDAAAQPVH
ncbi:MFS transporter [Micromonospora zingiberis]|uniref:MFS transporter n=1 Tax=Micromonospora zingiberis TaxID=2053011 RepID=A0A4R0GI03_9ACTN|nr:MFS transporter [Micromonospora zingiberis]TCB96766.1 MFS transporter [Micromonospora zingiberis]